MKKYPTYKRWKVTGSIKRGTFEFPLLADIREFVEDNKERVEEFIKDQQNQDAA